MKSMNSAMKTMIGAGGMVILILDAATALQGAAQGLELCVKSVIPSLFPFLVFSIYLTGNIGSIRFPILKPLCRLCRIPNGSEGILLTGLLGGYPAGAQAVAQAYESGILSKEYACRMLGFCNNAGPAFLFGMLSPYFSRSGSIWILWFIHISTAIITSVLLPGGDNIKISATGKQPISFPQSMNRALRTMALICGWVVLFRIVTVFLDRWVLWLLPKTAGIVITGLLELTNGCINLNSIPTEVGRFIIASVFLSTGGLCVGMQTTSVTGDLGTGMYFPGKILQCSISILLCGIVLPLLYPGTKTLWLMIPALSILGSTCCFLYFRKNNCSNFQLQGV